MADLTDILGGIFTPPSEPEPESPEVQLQDAMAEHGLIPPREIIFDGKLRKFEGVKHKNRNKSSWYRAFRNDVVPGACFGDFSLNNLWVNWHANIGRSLTPAENAAYHQKIAETRLDVEKLELSRKEAVKRAIKMIWNVAKPAPCDHPYLVKKKISPHCARVNGSGELILPLFNNELELAGLQFVECHGDNFIKKFRTGSEPKGAFCIIGEIDDGYKGRLYVAEGFATAASIHEATGVPVVVAYSANNLSAAIASVKESLPRNEIIIVADNDASETGQREAEKAANQHNITYIVPPIEGDANDFVNNGGDLKALLDGVKAKNPFLTTAEMTRQPAPINWIVEGFVQDNALVMVFGPSGSGKTFVVLDWCMRIASGMPEWNGKRIKPGTVAYMAGEGVYGMKGRMTVFVQCHGIDAEKTNLYVSADGGYDINTAEGLKCAFDDISSLPEKPSVVVIDTLHRFFNGDENSSRDVKTMLDACNTIMREFDCTVIIVHHTGVSSEAQNRARGSSAWRAALDIEIAVTQKNGVIEVCQKKAKDSELSNPEHLELLPIEIDGWVDQYGGAFKSAVVVPSDKKPDDNVDDENETRRQKKPMVEKYKQLISNAWLYGSDKAIMEGKPYISREELKEFLAENEGMKASTIEQHLKPSSGRMISKLIECAYIEPCNDGWLIVSDQDSSALMLLSEETNEETDAD